MSFLCVPCSTNQNLEDAESDTDDCSNMTDKQLYEQFPHEFFHLHTPALEEADDQNKLSITARAKSELIKISHFGQKYVRLESSQELTNVEKSKVKFVLDLIHHSIITSKDSQKIISTLIHNHVLVPKVLHLESRSV